MRIALLLPPSQSDPSVASVSYVTAEVADCLRSRGASVDMLLPEQTHTDLAEIRVEHDLYVLKSKTALGLAIARIAARAGVPVVNTVQASILARDKVASTAILAAAGISVPRSWTTATPALVRPLLAAEPLWLKPWRGSHGLGVRRLGTPDDLDRQGSHSVDAHGLPVPLFAQAEVRSDGIDLKVYVVGERMWGVARRFPAKTLVEKQGQQCTVPEKIAATARATGRALGLELYGVDFLVCGERGVVVDVNALPGFKGAVGASRALADYLYQRAGVAA